MSFKHSLVHTVVLLCTTTQAALAGSHLWRFNEVFSDADGTIQFVELKESAGSSIETQLAGKWVRSDDTGKQFVFPNDLTGSTSNKHLLLATAGFAALPGAPTPDYIIPDGFFSLTGDTLRYWTYSAATMSWTAGQVPIDGVMSLGVDGTTSINSPTNYAGETGSIDIGVPVPTASAWGLLALTLLLVSSATTILRRRRAQSPSASA